VATIPLGDGKGITWEPTEELLCSACRESFNPTESLKTVFFMFDYVKNREWPRNRRPVSDYWYFHEGCRSITKRLKDMGANIRWLHYDMPYILGFYIDRDGYRTIVKDREKHHEWFKPGVYDTIVEQWRSTLKGLDTRVTETQDITTLVAETITTPLAKVIQLQQQSASLEDKPGWLALRFATLKRDKYRCRLCGTAAEDGDHVRLEVDHRIARFNGGTNDPGNLWTLCFACNRGKGIQAI
jgi:5-methylcytosine-specific restriction endonuclease McrA